MTTNLSKKSFLTACVFFFLDMGMCSHCAATSASWTTDGSGNWNSNGNWSAAFPNAASEVATYNIALTNPITVTLGEDITVGSIIFGSTLDNNVTIGAVNTITLSNGGSVAAITVSGTTANTISSAISLSDDLTVTQGSSSTFTLSGGVSGISKGLTKAGTGALTLSGDNTYTGATTISAGTLAVAGSIATTASVTNNATLEFDTAAGNQTFAKVISGTGALVKSNSNSLTLGAVNTFAGAITINGGSIIQGIASGIPSTAAVTLADTSGVALTLGSFTTTIASLAGGGSNGGNVSLGLATLTVGDSNSTSYGGVLSSTQGGLTKQGSGVLTLTGVNTYVGTTTINAGTLRFGGTTIVPATNVVVLADVASAILDLNDNSATLGSISGGGPSGGNITLGSGTLTIGNSSDQTYAGVISETGGVTKAGSGTLTLSGTNTYTGATQVQAGTLRVSSGSLNSSSGVAVSSGAILEYSTTLGDLTLTNVVSGAGGFTKSGTGTLTASSTNEFTGPLAITGGTLRSSSALAFLTASSTTVNGGATLTSSDGTTANFPVLSGTGSIVLLGSTGSISSQTDNGSSTFTGVVTGTSAGNTVTATGSSGNNRFTLIGDQSSYLGTFRASGGSILRIRGAFTNAALLSISGSTSAIEVDTTDGSTSYGNLISGAGTLRVLGTNTFTLSGTQTFFTGNTEVNGGTFNLTGSILNSPTTTVSSGARMKGTGTVNNLVCTGTMQPGGSIGTTVVLGNYTQSSGSTLDIEFDTQGNASLLDITGTATVASNTTLNLIPQGGRRYREDQVYTFLDADGGLTGTFTTETIANSNLHGAAISVTYTANQGRIVLTGIPDPLECDIAMLSITSNLAARTNQIQLGMVTEIQNQRLMETFYCPRNYTEQIEDDDPYDFYTRKKDKEYKTKHIEEKKRAFYHPYLLFDYSKDQMKAMPYQAKAKDLYRSVGAGCDFYFLKEFILGGSLGYTDADGRSKEKCGKVASDTYNLGLYFQSEVYEDLYIDGALQGAKSYYEIKRDDIEEGMKLSKPHGYEVASQLRFLAQKSIYALRIRPFMAWNYLLQQVSNYRERRDGFNILDVGKDHFSIVELALGSNFWAPFWFGRNLDWNLVPNLGFSFVQAIARNSHSVETAFITNLSAITRNSIRKTSRRYWVFEAGLSSYFRRCSEFFFTYKGTFDERYTNVQEYRIGARASF